MLYELHSVFGYAAPPDDELARLRKAMRRSRGDLVPEDSAEASKLLAHELAEARPLLEELAPLWRSLACRPVLPPFEYAKRWRAVVKAWNEAVSTYWAMLPPLCEVCGRAVIRRAATRLKGGDVRISLACSEACRKRAKDRRQDRRR